MRARLWMFGAALCAWGAALAGCGPATSPIGGKIRTPDQIPRNLASLSPGTTELAGMTSLPLIGRSAQDTGTPALRALPIVCSVKPDYEQLAALRPSLVLYDADLFSKDEIARINQAGIKTLAIGGDTVDAFIDDLYRLGTATMSETLIAEYIERIRTERTVDLADGFAVKPKVAIVMTEPNASPMIAGVNSFYADVVRAAGADVVGPSATKFVTISSEGLAALAPDALIVPCEKGNYETALQDPHLAGLAAVKARKIVGIDSDVFLRRGAQVDQAIKALHVGLHQVAG